MSRLILGLLVTLALLAPQRAWAAETPVNVPPTISSGKVAAIVRGTPLERLAGTISQTGKDRQVDPAFALAVWTVESSLDRAGASVPNKNPGNLICAAAKGVTCSGRWAQYPTLDAAVADWFAYIVRFYYAKGHTTVESIIHIYAPPVENNTSQYIATVKRLLAQWRSEETGAPAPTLVPTEAPAPTTVPTAAPPADQPPDVQPPAPPATRPPADDDRGEPVPVDLPDRPVHLRPDQVPAACPVPLDRLQGLPPGIAPQICSTHPGAQPSIPPTTAPARPAQPIVPPSTAPTTDCQELAQNDVLTRLGLGSLFGQIPAGSHCQVNVNGGSATTPGGSTTQTERSQGQTVIRRDDVNQHQENTYHSTGDADVVQTSVNTIDTTAAPPDVTEPPATEPPAPPDLSPDLPLPSPTAQPPVPTARLVDAAYHPPAQPASGGETNCQKVVRLALEKMGSPYVYGAEGPTSFDCSGLVQYVYGKVGVRLPRTSAAQGQVGANNGCTLANIHGATTDCWQLGDIMHLNGHVALYAGNGLVAGCENPTIGCLTQDPTKNSWYRANFRSGRRVLQCTTTLATGAGPQAVPLRDTGEGDRGLPGWVRPNDVVAAVVAPVHPAAPAGGDWLSQLFGW